MNVSRMLRWGVSIACMMVAGLYASTAEAGPLVAQPNLTQAVAPTTVGFHGWGGGRGSGYGYGSYRGWGSGYNYGRPSLYYSGYRGGYGGGYGGGYSGYNRSFVRQSYGSAYSYGYSSPYCGNSYYGNSYSSPCSCGSTGYSSYSPVSYNQPVVYSQPAQPVVYSQSVGYAQPTVYTQPVYSSGYYARPVMNYSGYSSYSYPTSRSYGVQVGGFGYSRISPYYSSGYYGGSW